MSALLLKARLEAPRVGKFLTVGASGVVVNSVVLLLVATHLPVLLASAIATEIAIIYC
jgi:putative flippase GtrA